MLKITVPKVLPELYYIIDVLIGEYLGLAYQISLVDNQKKTTIELQNGKSIKLNNAFFNQFQGTYSLDLIPKKTFELSALNNFRIIGIYGIEVFKIKDHEVEIGVDIFGSAFFMLSRWEEKVIVRRDHHKRSMSEDSLAFKKGFLYRPIVNEYVDFLWHSLKHLGFSKPKKKRTYTIVPTHDVDLPKLWWNKKDYFKSLVRSTLKKKSIKNTLELIRLRKESYKLQKDPFDTFDLFMDLSEKSGVKSHFFFMTGGTSSKDNFYSIKDPFLINLIENIKKREHLIGLHPSYNSYNDEEQFKKEKDLLEQVSGVKVETGRQHFLRFENPVTWQVWENNQMQWDSTLSYADSVGFRCGTCYPFSVYDIENRTKLNLIERPLIVMDGSLVTYQNKSLDDANAIVSSLKKEVKKHDGEFVFLWHNSAFATPLWSKYEPLLIELYQS